MDGIFSPGQVNDDRDVIRRSRPCENCIHYNADHFIKCNYKCNYTHDSYREAIINYRRTRRK